MDRKTEQRFEESNAEARKRSNARKNFYDEWRKSRVADPMVPYVQVGDSDSRPIVEGSSSPVRRAYLHTYGYTRAERRAGMSVLTSQRRNDQRRKNKYLFQQIWDVQRARNESA